VNPEVKKVTKSESRGRNAYLQGNRPYFNYY